MASMQKTRITADDLFVMPDDEFRYELERGKLVKMPPAGFEHGDIGGRIHVNLASHIRLGNLGRVPISDTGYRLADDHVLAPDVSFVSESRIPASGPPEGFFHGAPDLAVEVISPSERERRLAQKVAGYLSHGCKMVILVRPGTRRVEVHTPGREAVTLGPGDVLDGGDAVRGWRLPLSEIFD